MPFSGSSTYVFWSCSGGLHVWDPGIWWLQTVCITVHSFSHLSTLQVLVMEFVWPHRVTCYIKCLSHLILKQGAERNKLHAKTIPFSVLTVKRLLGANWTTAISKHPSSFLPHHAFSSFSSYLLGFSFLSSFSPSLFHFLYIFLGIVKPAARVALEALYAHIK